MGGSRRRRSCDRRRSLSGFGSFDYSLQSSGSRTSRGVPGSSLLSRCGLLCPLSLSRLLYLAPTLSTPSPSFRAKLSPQAVPSAPSALLADSRLLRLSATEPSRIAQASTSDRRAFLPGKPTSLPPTELFLVLVRDPLVDVVELANERPDALTLPLLRLRAFLLVLLFLVFTLFRRYIAQPPPSPPRARLSRRKSRSAAATAPTSFGLSSRGMAAAGGLLGGSSVRGRRRMRGFRGRRRNVGIGRVGRGGSEEAGCREASEVRFVRIGFGDVLFG
jgi:hypothetical protein